MWRLWCLLDSPTHRATLSYWIYIGRSDITGDCLDTFHSYLRLRTEQSDLIGTVLKLCNTEANGWVQYSFDVTHDLQPYIGKPIQIEFEAIGLSTQRANFVVDIDDVTLYVTQS